MVYCRQCQKKVNDCEHFVFPIEAKHVSVFDARVETIAYAVEKRVLEIAFKSGQVWQLFESAQTSTTFSRIQRFRRY
jgi:hypothetical protein